MDLVDAVGLFGALGGVLAIALPYFVGLTAALSATLFGVGVIRAAQIQEGSAKLSSETRRFVLGFAAAIAGWAAFLLFSGRLGVVGPALLGASGLPLWRAARRPLPFGGR
jgi:hypothetical protein